MSNSNLFKFKNVDDVNSGYQNTSGWFKKLHTSESASNRELDRHPILRLKNVDDKNAIQGVIRFNDEKIGGAAFEGYDGIQWNTFSSTPGNDGKDGLNYRTVVSGQSLFNTGDTGYYSLFKNVTTTVTQNDTSSGDNTTDSQISTTIHKIPTFKYDSSVDNKNFDLTNHNIIFEPVNDISYKVIVNDNECWPPCDYSKHIKYSTINNGVQLGSNNYFLYNLSNKFKFYDTFFNEIYVNENGYITFGTGESSYVQNILQNHLLRKRISALFLNLTKNSDGVSSATYNTNISDIYIGTGKYGEQVITFQNYLHNPATNNYRVDFQIRLFLEDSTDENGLFSDDNYKAGTIQISYNNNPGLKNISPIVGLSNGGGYNSATFSDVYFSNLKTNIDFNETTGIGVPYLRALIALRGYWVEAGWDGWDGRKKKTFTDYQPGQDDVLGDETIDSTIYTTYSNDNYYIKILDLGEKRLYERSQSIAVAIKSIFDYPEQRNNSNMGSDETDPNGYTEKDWPYLGEKRDLYYYSDSTNYFYDFDSYKYTNFWGERSARPALDENWESIPDSKFVDLTSVHSSSTIKTKDYINIYDNLTSNADYKTQLHNSQIYRIQVKYENCMVVTTVDGNTTYSIEKRLFLKIIYTLKSDLTDGYIGGTSLLDAVPLTFNRTSGGDNYGPFNYFPNTTQYFSINRSDLISDVNFNVLVYDYTFTATDAQIGSITYDYFSQLDDVDMNLRAIFNKSLTVEILDDTGSVIISSKNTDGKITTKVGSKTTTLFNYLQKLSPGTTQYYLKITGSHKIGLFGISIVEPAFQASNTQLSSFFSNHKFTKVNADDLDLTTSSSVLSANQRVYSRADSDNMLFLLSDSDGSNMKMYNYNFSGGIDSDKYPITTTYSNNQTILDIGFLDNKKLVTYKNGSNVDIDIYNDTLGAGNEKETTLTISSINPTYTFTKIIREFSNNGSDPDIERKYLINIILKNDHTLSLNCIVSSRIGTDSFTTTTIPGFTDTLIIHQIVDVLILKNTSKAYVFEGDNYYNNQGKHNIFVIGNNVISKKAYAIKLSLDTSSKEFSLVSIQEIKESQDENKILFAGLGQYDSSEELGSFYVLFEQGVAGANGYVLKNYLGDFTQPESSMTQILTYGSVALSVNTTTILNFKTYNHNTTMSADFSSGTLYSYYIKDRVIITWEDSTNNNRYYLVYGQSYNNSDSISVIKSGTFTSAEELLDISSQVVNVNGNAQIVYSFINKNSAADEGTYKLKLSMKSESESGNFIEFLSTIDYLNDLDFGYNAKSLFNKFNEESFSLASDAFHLIESPDPLPSKLGKNDYVLFHFGFDNSTTPKKLILEGFGQLSSVVKNTGETVSSNFTVKVVNENLTFQDCSLLESGGSLERDYFSFNGMDSSNQATFDIFDINSNGYPADGISGYSGGTGLTNNTKYRRFNTSMNTFSKTVESTTTYYTGILYGPTTITDNPSSYSSSNFYANMHMVKYTYKFDIYSDGVYKSQNSFTLTSSGGSIYNKYSDFLDIISITDGFIIIEYYAGEHRSYDGSLEGTPTLKIIKYILQDNGTFVSTTQSIIPASLEAGSYPAYSIQSTPVFKIKKIEDDTQLLITVRRDGALDSYVSSNYRDNYYFIFININNLTYSLNNYSSGMGNIYFPIYNSGVHSNYGNVPALSSGTPTKLLGLLEHIYFNHDDKHLIYFFDYNYMSGNDKTSNHGLHIIKCERNGNASTGGFTNIGSNYFNSSFVNHTYLNFSSSLGTLRGDYTQSGAASLEHFYNKNVYFKDGDTFYIYFMAKFQPDYYKVVDDEGETSYKSLFPSSSSWVQAGLGSTGTTLYELRYSHTRIVRMKIEYNSTFSSENIELENAYTFSSGDDENVKEIETLYTKYANLSQFDMVMDGTTPTRYIIVSSNGQLYQNDSSQYVDVKIVRNAIDFIIYKVGTSGALSLLCYGKQQNILALNIENNNLIVFAPADEDSLFDADGKYLKIFKKPIDDIEGASDKSIVMGTTIFATKEPTSNDDNTIHYPHAFMSVREKTPFVYNGALTTVTPNVAQTNDLAYNIVVAHDSSDSAHSYSSNRDIGILMFGDFTTDSSSGGSSGGGGEDTTVNTQTGEVSIANKLQHFFNYSGLKTNGNFLIGRNKDNTYNTNENDVGVVFYNYISPESTDDTDNFFIKTNSIPNYDPIYKGQIIKGSWYNELGNDSNSNYSIMPQDYGWVSTDNITNGTSLKVPHTLVSINPKTVIVGDVSITETFWFIGDKYWDIIMENPGYSVSSTEQDSNGYYITNSSLVSDTVNDKLLTPPGRIGVAANGVLFYNFSNLERNKNAVEEFKPDVFGGMGDSDNAYHYHSWPVNLEVMLNLGHPNTSLGVRNTPSLTDTFTEFPILIHGMTYYFNQIDLTNYNADNLNKFALKYEPVYKGTVYRYRVKQENNEYYLTPLDFAKNYTSVDSGGNPIWERRKVLSKVKSGDTIIFHQDELFSGDDGANYTKHIMITLDTTDSNDEKDFTLIDNINRDDNLVSSSTLSIIGTIGTDAKTVFNVPPDFDVKYARYQPYYALSNDSLILDQTAFDDSTYKITKSDHGFESYDAVIYVPLDTSNTITGLAANTVYYIIKDSVDADKFQLAVNTSDVGTSTEVEFSSVSTGSYILRPVTKVLDMTGSPPINTTTSEITLTNHGLNTGDSLLYEHYTTAQLTGLTATSSYFVNKVDDDKFKLSTTLSDALAGTNITLSSNNGDLHFFRINNIYNKNKGSYITTGKFFEYYVGIYHTGDDSRIYKIVNEKTIEVDTSGSDINTSTNEITINSHGLLTGAPLLYNKYSTNSSVGAEYLKPLEDKKIFYVIKINDNKIKLAQSSAHALSGTAITLTQKGTGTQYFLRLDKDLTTTNSSFSLNNKAYSDIIYFNQPGIYKDYNLVIKTDNIDSGTNVEDGTYGAQISDVVLESDVTVRGGLYFAPNNNFSISTSTITLYYNAGVGINEDSTDMAVTGGAIKSGLYTRRDEYNFNNTLVRHGLPGNSYCPFTKFIIPTLEEIKVNYLTMKYNDSKFEIYGKLNTDYYTQSSSELLSEVKLFLNSRYIITLDSSVQTASKVPKFSAVSSSYAQYSFEYENSNTFNHDTTNNELTFRVGEEIRNLYLYDSNDTSDTDIGSTYNGKIYSSKTYDLLKKIRFTDLNTDVSPDAGSNLGTKEIFPNKIYVKVDTDVYKFYGSTTTGLDYYKESTTEAITNLKLYNNTKYEFDVSDSTMSGKKLKFSTHISLYNENNITFSDTFDDTVSGKVTLIVKGLDNLTTVYPYDGNDTTDITIRGTTDIETFNANPINIFTKVATDKLEFYSTPSSITSFFKGYTDYELASIYLSYKLGLAGPDGHSPLLGYAFDGNPIYGPLGYDKNDSTYGEKDSEGNNLTNYKVKLLKSSYTGGQDGDQNPRYVQGSGDLDICNGIFSITPEYPNGVFHYVCTIQLDSNGNYSTSLSTLHGYFNETSNIIKPAYPYIIGAFKNQPEFSNFNTTEVTTTNTDSTSEQTTEYQINFKSLKGSESIFNGINSNSIQISQDEYYLNLQSNPTPYIWNFTNRTLQDDFFGRDNKFYSNSITALKSDLNDTKFKAYGSISKWIAKESISKGLAVRLANTTDSVPRLVVELYDTVNTPNETQRGAAFLGIALNDAAEGEPCYVCTRGITTVRLELDTTDSRGDYTLNCGAYGILMFSSQKGYIYGLTTNDIINENTPIAGYFLENTTIAYTASSTTDYLLLFNVQGNFNF